MPDIWEDRSDNTSDVTEQTLIAVIRSERLNVNRLQQQVDELLRENRKLWATFAYMYAAVGIYDATCRQFTETGDTEGVADRANEANDEVAKAGQIIGQMVLLTLT